MMGDADTRWEEGRGNNGTRSGCAFGRAAAPAPLNSSPVCNFNTEPGSPAILQTRTLPWGSVEVWHTAGTFG
ncbi:hypothetical protein chiPu_0005294 [Chiloscyllium punctatum]|uniref:Uncharacterized protein n=1 Tax=Chiloscyllium punctatum TaxID=137246 RepID=A0A401S908_CHIPU|nr:hypothetical protein [Chiloscyllium punctatum]